MPAVAGVMTGSPFDVLRDDGAAAGRRWTRSGGTPMAMLERDWMRVYARHAAKAHADTGNFVAAMHHVRWIEGWCYVGSDADTDDTRAARERHRKRVERWAAKGTTIYRAALLPELARRLAEVRRRRPRTTADLRRVVDHLGLAMDAAGYAMGDLHWRFSAIERPEWADEYVEITGRPRDEAAVLLGGLGHDTARLAAALRRLARLRLAGDAAAFDAALGQFLRRYGRRTGYGYGSASGFTTPTWGMRPELVVGMVDAYARQDLDRLDAADRTARQRRVALARAVRRELAGDPKRLGRFEAAYRRAVAHVRDSEHSNQLIEQDTIGSMREAVHRTGLALAERGSVDDPDDVLHLSLDELRAHPTGDLRPLVAERKAELARQARLDAPLFVVAGDQPSGPRLDGHRGARPSRRRVTSITATPASPGTAVGRVHIAPMVAEPPDVAEGDVLVAVEVGPAWTPVLPLAAAMVLEHGAPDQHGAIMAREFGIPAVIHAAGATKTLRDGQRVEVDGTTGTIRVLER